MPFTPQKHAHHSRAPIQTPKKGAAIGTGNTTILQYQPNALPVVYVLAHMGEMSETPFSFFKISDWDMFCCITY